MIFTLIKTPLITPDRSPELRQAITQGLECCIPNNPNHNEGSENKSEGSEYPVLGEKWNKESEALVIKEHKLRQTYQGNKTHHIYKHEGY